MYTSTPLFFISYHFFINIILYPLTSYYERLDSNSLTPPPFTHTFHLPHALNIAILQFLLLKKFKSLDANELQLRIIKYLAIMGLNQLVGFLLKWNKDF